MVNEGINIKALIGYALIVLGGGAAWGTLQTKVAQHDEKLSQIEQSQHQTDQKVDDQRSTLVGVAQEVHDMHEWMQRKQR